MARERWFYAEGHRRMGPVARRELVDALLQLTDPRTCLIWRKGMQTWAIAAEVPEIDQQLAALARVSAPPEPPPGGRGPEVPPRRPASPRPMQKPAPRRGGGNGPMIIGGAALAVVAICAGAWFLWPRTPPTVVPPPSAGVTPTPVVLDNST